MLFDGVDGGFDEIRFVANDAELIARQQRLVEGGEPGLQVVGDFHRVGAGLLANLQQNGGRAVQAGLRARLDHAVFDARDVAQPHRMAGDLADDDIAELSDRGDPAPRPQVTDCAP